MSATDHAAAIKTGVAGTAATWSGLGVSLTAATEVVQFASACFSLIVGMLTVCLLTKKIRKEGSKKESKKESDQ